MSIAIPRFTWNHAAEDLGDPPERPTHNAPLDEWVTYISTRFAAVGLDEPFLDFAERIANHYELHKRRDFDWTEFRDKLERTEAEALVDSLLAEHHCGPIQVSQSQWEAAVALPQCPTLVPYSAPGSFDHWRRGKPCDSKSCPDCGPRMVREDLVKFAIESGRATDIYHWGGLWDAAMSARVRQRRSRANEETQKPVGNLTVHRRKNGEKHVEIFSNVPLEGRKSPTGFVRLSRREAFCRLVKTLALPRVGQRFWLGSWAPEAKQKGVTSDWRRYPQAPEYVIEEAEQMALESLERSGSVDVVRHTPSRWKTTFFDVVVANIRMLTGASVTPSTTGIT